MKKLLVFGLSVMLLWSCNNVTEKSAAHQETENHAEHQDDESSNSIELNNGEKWLVNEEMKPFVVKGEELVNTYIQEGKTDYKALAQQLKEQNDQLVKSCTMGGKSHDELHKWLHPHLEIIKVLQNETDATKASEIVLRLQHSYQQYHQYFN